MKDNYIITHVCNTHGYEQCASAMFEVSSFVPIVLFDNDLLYFEFDFNEKALLSLTNASTNIYSPNDTGKNALLLNNNFCKNK